MAIKKQDLIKVWDDKNLIEKNIEFLKTPTKNVQFPITSKTRQIIEDLIITYRSTPCAGIASNQIGYDKKLFIGMKHDRDKSVSGDSAQNFDNIEPDSENLEIYINPQIDRVDKNSTQTGEEGCLSIPDVSLQIERYDNIKVRYYNISGNAIKKPLSGFISRLFQHELDHLEGQLMFENTISNIASYDHHNIEQNYKIKALLKYIKNRNTKYK